MIKNNCGWLPVYKRRVGGWLLWGEITTHIHSQNWPAHYTAREESSYSFTHSTLSQWRCLRMNFRATWESKAEVKETTNTAAALKKNTHWSSLWWGSCAEERRGERNTSKRFDVLQKSYLGQKSNDLYANWPISILQRDGAEKKKQNVREEMRGRWRRNYKCSTNFNWWWLSSWTFFYFYFCWVVVIIAKVVQNFPPELPTHLWDFLCKLSDINHSKMRSGRVLIFSNHQQPTTN